MEADCGALRDSCWKTGSEWRQQLWRSGWACDKQPPLRKHFRLTVPRPRAEVDTWGDAGLCWDDPEGNEDGREGEDDDEGFEELSVSLRAQKML